MYDSTELNVQGLQALGISAESFRSLLTSILMGKLPSEIRIKEKLSIEDVMRIVSHEVTTRERSATSSSNPLHHQRSTPSMESTTSRSINCCSTHDKQPGDTYLCVLYQEHQSTMCTVVKSVKARRDLLRKAGRCYLCL